MFKIDMHVTKNFIFRHFKVSNLFPKIAKLIRLNKTDKLKIYYMCATILQPIRDFFGVTIITNGKRSFRLNKKVGGAVSSDHLFKLCSCAVDFTLKDSGQLDECFKWIQKNLKHAYGQVVYYPERKFIHISLPTPNHRSKAYIYTKAKGLVRINA